MKIIAIKTNDGYLISDNIKNDGHFNSALGRLNYDNERATPTFKKDWWKISKKPTVITEEKTQPSINQRYELKTEFDNGVFKKVWLRSETIDEDYDFISEFENIKGLYDYKEDKQPNIFVEVPFEWEEILEIETFKEPTGFNYKAIGEYDKPKADITQNNLSYTILAQVLTPSILIHNQPCKLSSKETYDIVRAFIKNNINPMVAEITSDYDFCFTVKKKIPLAKPYSYQTDVNNSIFSGRKRKPKYETRMVDKKSVQIFEMTWKGYRGNAGYEGYTCIEPFEAENQDALKEYIDAYLKELITVINEPICECDKCNGLGVLFNKKNK